MKLRPDGKVVYTVLLELETRLKMKDGRAREINWQVKMRDLIDETLKEIETKNGENN